MNEADKFLQDYLAQEQRKTQQPQATPPRSTPVNLRPSYGMNARVQQVKQPEPAYYQASVTPPSNPSYAAPQGEQYIVSMVEAFKRFWTNWSLKGRSSRSEVWMNVLASFCIWFVIGFILSLLGGGKLLNALQIIWNVATMWPAFALLVRRCHDIGKSAAFVIVFEVLAVITGFIEGFYGTIPDWALFFAIGAVISGIVMLCFCVRRSDPHENQYGPVPNLR